MPISKLTEKQLGQFWSWATIIRQLVDLWKEPKEDDYGRLRPTQHAFDQSVYLLINAAIIAIIADPQCWIPAGCVSTDSEGGVRIEWIRPRESVHLVVPATKNRAAFIYHQVGNDYETEDATPERLAYWLHRIESHCSNKPEGVEL